MAAKRFALFGGIAMLVIGLLALVPALSQFSPDLPALKNSGSYGLFMGLFAMNIFNKIALIVLGCVGIYGASQRSTDLPSSINFSRVTFGLMTLAVILGAIPSTCTLFGYMPLFGYTIAFNAFFAVLSGYAAFALSAKVPKMAAYNDLRQPTRDGAPATKPVQQH